MVDDEAVNVRQQVLHTICDGSPTHLEFDVAEAQDGSEEQLTNVLLPTTELVNGTSCEYTERPNIYIGFMWTRCIIRCSRWRRDRL